MTLLFDAVTGDGSNQNASGGESGNADSQNPLNKPGAEGAAAADAARKAEADKAAADKGTADKAAADKAAADKKAADDSKNQVPEKYEFKAEDGHELDQELVGELSQVAKKHKLTQEQANEFFQLGQKLAEKHANEYVEMVNKTRTEWVQEIKSDPVLSADLEGNLAIAKKAIAAADTDGKLVKWLNESGAGDNPHLVRAFHKLGKLLGNDRLVTGGNRQAGNNAGGAKVFSYANSDHK